MVVEISFEQLIEQKVCNSGCRVVNRPEFPFIVVFMATGM